MKKIVLLLFITISLLLKVNGQCSPNSIFTSLAIPGVYPPAVQISNLPVPLPLGIADGSVGISYNQTLT